MSIVSSAVAVCLARRAGARGTRRFQHGGGTLSVKSHRVDGDSLVLVLRGGGEIVCESSTHRADRAGRSAVSRARGAAGRPRRCVAATAPTPVPYGEIIDRVSAEQGVPVELVRAVIQVESAYQRARPVAEGRDGADAADAGDGAAVRRRRPVRSGGEHRGRHQAPQVAARAVSGWRWRWRPTTPARRRSSGSTAFRRTPRRGTTSRASSRSRTGSKTAQSLPAFRGAARSKRSRGSVLELGTIAGIISRDGCALEPTAWNSAAGWHRRAAKSSKASTSPTAKRGCGTSSRRRGCSSSRCSRRARHRGHLASSCRSAQRRQHARVPGLQPGAGDAAQGRHAARAVARPAQAARRRRRSSAACWTTCTRRCDRARRCRTRSRRTATCSRASTRRRCWPASAAATSTRCCGATSSTRRSSRRVKRKTVSALVYPAILVSLAARAGVDHRAQGRAGVRRFLRARSARELPLVTRIIVARLGRSLRSQFLLIIGWRSSAVDAACVGWMRQPGQKARFDRLLLAAADARQRSRRSSRRRRWRARWRRCSAAACRSSTRSTSRAQSVGNQYMARQLDIVSARVREGRVVRRRARGAARVSRTSRSRWRRSASRPARCRTC